MFSCEYCEIFINTYLEEHLRTAASVCLLICGANQKTSSYTLTRKFFLSKCKSFKRKDLSFLFAFFLIMLSPKICLIKVNDGNTRIICEICSKWTIKTSERRHWQYFGVFLVTLNRFTHYSGGSIADFEQTDAAWFFYSMNCFRRYKSSIP